MTHLNGNKKIKYLPAVICVIMLLICAFVIRTTGFEELLEFTGSEPLLTLGIIWFLYALKSLSVVFPATLLFIASASVFPYPAAVAVNIVGLAISFTLPYYIGRFSGSDAMKLVTDKYPKAHRLISYGQQNNLITVYISRAITFVPNDIVSMLHGALGMPFVSFIIGSLMGLLPEMLVVTYIGGRLSDLTFKSVLIMILLIVTTAVFSFLLNKRLSRLGIKSEQSSDIDI